MSESTRKKRFFFVVHNGKLWSVNLIISKLDRRRWIKVVLLSILHKRFFSFHCVLFRFFYSNPMTTPIINSRYIFNVINYYEKNWYSFEFRMENKSVRCLDSLYLFQMWTLPVYNPCKAGTHHISGFIMHFILIDIYL